MKFQNLTPIIAALVLMIGAAFIVMDKQASITGYVVIPSYCNLNINSCIDLSGDGFITYDDEDIFAQFLLHNDTYIEAHRDIWNMSDFDNDGDVDQTDFQQCFVPMRDYYVDYKNRAVPCNPPVANNITNATTHAGCVSGCADLNGDGYVNSVDYAIMTNSSVNNRNITDTYYPMADLTGDGKINLEDRDCMVPYIGSVVTCNMHILYTQDYPTNCPDLTDEQDTGNDGRVDQTDVDLFAQYYESDNLKADMDGDGYVNVLDQYIFDQYVGKVVDCNIYHAPWHIGGIDRNNSAITALRANPIGGTKNFTQNFTTSREGQLTKIRFYMNATHKDGDVTIRIYPDATGVPNLTALIDQTTINAFNENYTHWETAYFKTPPVLTNNTKYHIVMLAINSSDGNYNWLNNSNGIIFEVFSSTACADFNGDGYVNDVDEQIIDGIPDGMTSSGAGSWNSSFDLNGDNVISTADVQILQDAILSGDLTKPAVQASSSLSPGNRSFGSTKYLSQSFKPLNSKLSIIELYLAADSSDKNGINVQILADNGSGYPTDGAIASAIISGFSNESFRWYNATFSDAVSMTIGTTYHIVVTSSTATTQHDYLWANATYADGDLLSSLDSGANWLLQSENDSLFRAYSGDPEWNDSFDVNKDGSINGEDIALVNAAIPSYNNIFWTPLVDFNAIFGRYEQLRDKTLGFDAYSGKILTCGLPTFTMGANNGRCEPEAPTNENWSNSIDCVACNYDGFCDRTEDFNSCSDCDFLRNMPRFAKFNETTSTDFTTVTNLSAAYDVVFDLYPYGRITFAGPINATSADFDSNINIAYRNASVNVSALPELNQTAEIWLYGITMTYPKLMKNDEKCSNCTIISYSDGLLKFNVSGFDVLPTTYYWVKEAAPDVIKFNGSLTTNFSFAHISDIENVGNISLYIESIGAIVFTQNINASEGNYTRDIEISRNGGTGGGGWVGVNTTADSRLNKSATIAIKNLNLYVPVIRLENMSVCPSDVCTILSYPNYPNRANCNYSCDIIFNVSKFSRYYVVENSTAPQFVNGPIPAIMWNSTQSATINISHYFFDVNNATLIYNATVTAYPSSISVDVNDTLGTVTFSSVNNWHGVSWVNFTAFDGNSTAASGLVSLIVTQNLPPQLLNETTLISWDEDNNVTFDLDDFYYDPNSDLLRYSRTFIGDSTNINISMNQSTGITTIVPDANWYGDRFVYFTANDSQYTANTNIIQLTVNSVNDVPWQNSTIEDIVIDEDDNITLPLMDYFKDVEDTQLQYSLFVPPTNFNVTIMDSNATFVPIANWFGSEAFYIRVEDSDGASILSNMFTIYVNSVNDPVSRTSKELNLTWLEDSNLTINLSEYLYDTDGNAVYFYNLDNSPNNNMSITFNYLTGMAKFSPKANWYGTIGINFSIQDPSSSLWNYTNLTVLNVNDLPVINLTNMNVVQNSYNDSINLSNYVSDVDNTKQEINWSYEFTQNVSHDVGVVISNITKIINVTATGLQNDSIILTAQDTPNSSSQIIVTITVIPSISNVSINYTNSTFVDSWVNGTNYNGTLSNVSGIHASTLNISNVTGPMIYVNMSYLFNSVIINSTIDNCDIYDSALENTVCKDTVIDPSDIHNSNTTGSNIVGSHVWDSNATYSNITNSAVEFSDVRDSNVLDSNTCSIYHTSLRNANVSGCVIYSGTILYFNGTMYNASASGVKNITDIINYMPNAQFTYTTSGLSASFTDNSTDINIPGELNDLLRYNWSFGDGVTDNSTNSTHAYAASGTYNVTVNVTDKFGLSSVASTLVTVSSGVVVTTGGGGGGGGSSRCYSYWRCSEWSVCTNGLQTRVCNDTNKCRIPSIPKPVESQSCGCSESWTCGEWSLCLSEGVQTRECTDSNACGTVLSKPETMQQCEYATPAEGCYDGIQNQGEEGVDCGGPCAPCAAAEVVQPAKSNLWLYIVLGLILLAGAGAASFIIIGKHKKSYATLPAKIEEKNPEIAAEKKIELVKEEVPELKISEIPKVERAEPVKMKIDPVLSKQISEYVAEMLHEGYSKVEIKSALTEAGWPTDVIAPSFKLYIKEMNGLKNYIAETLRKGFSKAEIIEELKKDGWSIHDIKHALFRYYKSLNKR